uniref:Rhodopsin domain-containing protein n=1 Tax=Fusarium oxysporum (strain Fo5176) TaxID=660025 RepID=A0A0D2YFG9_FUSOF
MAGDESVLRDTNDSRVSIVIGIAVFLMATSMLMVVLRVVSRAMVKQFRLDDMAAIASLMSFLFNYHRLLSASKLRRYCIGAMVLIVLWAGGVCILVLVILGFLTVGISIARMRWLEMDADMTWWNVSPALWSLGELTSAISCSCLPFFKPLTLRVKSSISRATAGHDHPRIPGGEGDEESNAHSSVGAGQKEFVQNSNLMRAVLFTLSFYLHNTYGLEEGVNIESKAGNGQTPLSYAAESGHEAVVKLLQSYKG